MLCFILAALTIDSTTGFATMPVTTRRSTASSPDPSSSSSTSQQQPKKVSHEDDGNNKNDKPSSPNSNKKKYRHKRNRSVSLATLPLGVGAAAKKTATAATKATPPKLATNNDAAPQDKPSSTSYKIRAMQMQDMAAVYKLGNTVFTAAEFPNMYRTWDDFCVVEAYTASSDYCFIAYDDSDNKTIVGFLLGQTVRKGDTTTRGYIEWVGVLPAYRRVGVATALIQAFTQAAQGCSLLLADTQADNQPAIQLLAKAGLAHQTGHVYLTCQLRRNDVPRNGNSHVDLDDLSFHFSYDDDSKKHRITIRNMEIQDLHPIYSIGEDIFTKHSQNLYNFWEEDLVLGLYLSDPEFCAVATVRDKDSDEEKVAAFAFGTTIEKPRSSWKYGYLVWLGCAREYQGMGLAKQLYDVMVELFAAERVRMVMIDTQHNNAAALKFFRKLGFGHDENHVYLSNHNAAAATPTAPSMDG